MPILAPFPQMAAELEAMPSDLLFPNFFRNVEGKKRKEREKEEEEEKRERKRMQKNAQV